MLVCGWWIRVAVFHSKFNILYKNKYVISTFPNFLSKKWYHVGIGFLCVYLFLYHLTKRHTEYLWRWLTTPRIFHFPHDICNEVLETWLQPNLSFYCENSLGNIRSRNCLYCKVCKHITCTKNPHGLQLIPTNLNRALFVWTCEKK